jgi:hypothetical protein
MFLVALHSIGRSFSAEMPRPPGPRHCGQLEAPAVVASHAKDENRIMTRGILNFEEIFIVPFL